MIYRLGEKSPVFDVSNPCYVAPNASIIGDVFLSSNVSVWFGVVIRGDKEKIVIGKNSNIQDCSVLHADPGYPLEVGAYVTVGHKAMLHGCTCSLIGINAVILNGAKIGKHCLIGANALVTENTEIPDGSMVLGSPGKVVRALDSDQKAMLKNSAEQYVLNGQKFRQDLEKISD